MDRKLSFYSLYFSFPFNKITSTLYSDDEMIRNAAFQQTLNTIELVISSHGFISMEMVMKFFGLRPTRHCPGINFTCLEDATIDYDMENHTYVIRLCLSNEMKLRPVLKYETEDQPEETGANLKVLVREEPEWTGNGTMETSGSAENGKI